MSLQQIDKQILNQYKQSKKVQTDIQYFCQQFLGFKIQKASMFNFKGSKVEVLAMIGRTTFNFQNKAFPICLGIYIPHEYPSLQPRVLVIPEGNQEIYVTTNITQSGVVIDFQGWQQTNNIIVKVQKCLELFSAIPPVRAKKNQTQIESNQTSYSLPHSQNMQQPKSQQALQASYIPATNQGSTQQTQVYQNSYIPVKTTKGSYLQTQDITDLENFRSKVKQIVSIYQNQVEKSRLTIRSDIEKLRSTNIQLSNDIKVQLQQQDTSVSSDSQFVFGTSVEQMVQQLLKECEHNILLQKQACQIASDEFMDKLVDQQELEPQELLKLLNINDVDIRSK
ncbi:UEV domain-containing protein [Spironucleus salmonicida]|uniref:UEV domain-containing protein n=1 Tax=Spironucleus salmonicida TaxID=348837 RepID=V6LQG5_9EUKA|nr:UEV domain-containing protein [Spironucleus salmonicida]|eukprot:EST45946.1 UEV domain-containing protein [Spironucleus salmonicida]